MKTHSLVRCAALLAVVGLAIPAFAKPVTKTIQITQNARIGKAELQAGEYRLTVDGNKVSIQKGKELVAEAEGRWEERAVKSTYDSILVGPDGRVQEVRFGGQKRVLILNE